MTCVRFARRSSASALEQQYASLLQAAGISDAEHQPASYNWAMTRDWMLLVPRGSEQFGPVTVNSMGFVGSFFVRSLEEIEFVQEQGCMAILSQLGVAW